MNPLGLLPGRPWSGPRFWLAQVFGGCGCGLRISHAFPFGFSLGQFDPVIRFSIQPCHKWQQYGNPPGAHQGRTTACKAKVALKRSAIQDVSPSFNSYAQLLGCIKGASFHFLKV
jgi:hypothetical protein